MRCPRCHAANPDTATFCGQCYDRFDAPTATSAADPSPLEGPSAVGDHRPQGAVAGAPTPTAEPAPAGAGTPRSGEGAHDEVAVGRFTVTDEGLTWRCAVCDTSHPAGEFVCTVCGAKMDHEPGRSTATVDWDHARRLELLAPGLGHLRTAQGGMGLARSGIVVVWLLGAVLLLTGGMSGLLTALPLLLGIAAVWATGPADLEAARRGAQPRLDPRRFMYLVIGVTTAVIIMGGVAVIA